MRREPSILHLDLDAFFAAVEQRDKPSLRGRPVVVGGTGGRGVVSTASYEARAFGARSAMPTAEARRLCPPGTAFLGGRFAAYRRTSEVVMALLRELSPLVEPVSIDEAYVDLAAGGHDLSVPGVTALAAELKARIAVATGGVTGSVGIGTSKAVAKIGSELDKPDGLTVVPPGEELAVLHPLPVRALGGVGPATAERLAQIGVKTIGDLHRLSLVDLTSLVGQAHGAGLYRLARADDDRPVVTDREAKSVSAEETFARDLTDPARLATEIEALATRVGSRLQRSGTSGRTVTLKVRRYDFSTLTRSQTLAHAVDDPRQIAEIAHRLLGAVDRSGGLRLLGVGVSGLSPYAQGDLFAEPTEVVEPVELVEPAELPADPDPGPVVVAWYPGQDVVHPDLGSGWVWGSGLNRVTVRFEGPRTTPGPVRTLAADDPALQPADPPDWTP
ncbi:MULTISPECIES: DNA polymerase IV [unclassified Modestobacter]|uniref:DNA polymerase IV n=1 Tax=unclassified Modestobacter TaxID=2643866 RepID=UPI0022AA143F|nr:MULTISPECIES: DNA polymerase IV [unclassified Modestobacter]MCZ2810940.1 DNA polymerase IV [Modestobacter sp. VKM Ac-2979]MCZ2840453.1 DNA polymerase IV [Modestobacter sp. VKM Ac-2980]MCZ2849581.1 DNA polymerase IV [Modestobacter sp. VKM Ac-2978]